MSFYIFQDTHRNFRRTLDSKRPIIETNLISGRQHVANEPIEEGNALQLTRNIRREVNKLSEQWLNLLNNSDNWQLQLEEGIQKFRYFQQMLDDGSARLSTAEAIKSRWVVIAGGVDKKGLLDQLKVRNYYNSLL